VAILNNIAFFDFHACQTSIAPPACGVGTPDSSEIGNLPISLAAGARFDVGYVIKLSGTVRVVPEPGAFVLLARGG
jgi:hypothetical protein